MLSVVARVRSYVISGKMTLTSLATLELTPDIILYNKRSRNFQTDFEDISKLNENLQTSYSEISIISFRT